MRTVRLSSDPNANDIPDDIIVDDERLLQSFRSSIPQPIDTSGYYDDYAPVGTVNYDWSTVFPSLGQSASVSSQWQAPQQPARGSTENTQAWFGIVFLVLLLLLFWW